MRFLSCRWFPMTYSFCLSALWICIAGCSSSFRQASVASSRVPSSVLTWRRQSTASIPSNPFYPVSHQFPALWFPEPYEAFYLSLYSLKDYLVLSGCKGNTIIRESTTNELLSCKNVFCFIKPKTYKGSINHRPLYLCIKLMYNG